MNQNREKRLSAEQEEQLAGDLKRLFPSQEPSEALVNRVATLAVAGSLERNGHHTERELQRADAIPAGFLFKKQKGASRTRSLAWLLTAPAVAILATTLVRFLPRDKPTPLQLLKEVREHYQQANTFSMRIEEHDCSSTFPGEYTQRLQWRKGGIFKIKVTSKENPNIPDFQCDGQTVMLTWPSGRRTSETLNNHPFKNHLWEQSGLYILSWLQKGPLGNKFVDGMGKDFPITWTYGPRTQYYGYKVRELVGHLGDEIIVGSFFIDEEKKTLVAKEENHSREGIAYALFLDQKFDPDLSTDRSDPGGAASPQGKHPASNSVHPPPANSEVPNEVSAALNAMNRPAPIMRLKDTKGRLHSLSDYEGKVVLLDFYASWCQPCNELAPELETQFWQPLKEKGLVVIGVDTAEQGEALQKAQKFQAQHHLSYPILVDPNSEMVKLWVLKSFPTLYLLDRHGNIRYRLASSTPEVISAGVDRLLKEK